MNPTLCLADPSDADLDVWALTNLEYEKRFVIWRDFHINMPTTGAVWDGDSTLNGGAIIPFRIFANLRMMACSFTDTSGVVANIMDNSFHILAIGTNGITATLRYVSRLRFIG